MIVEMVFQVIVAAVSAILDLLPETPVPPNLAGKFTAAFGGIDWAWAALSDWFPVGELGAALAGLMLRDISDDRVGPPIVIVG